MKWQQLNRATVCMLAVGAASLSACVGGGGGGGGGGGFFVAPDSGDDLNLSGFDMLSGSDLAALKDSAAGDGAAGGGDAAATEAGGDDAAATADASAQDADSKDAATGCTKSAECDDSDPCTSDLCSGGKCKNNPIANCNKQPAPCDGKNACPANSGVCDNETHSCVPCLVSKDCGAGKVCAGKVCVVAPACKSDVDCKAAGKVCNKTAGACVECNQAGDCGANKTCIASICHDAPPCTSSKECDKVCDFKNGVCVDCMTGEDCPAGQICGADKICKAPICNTNACGAGQSFFTCKPDGSGYAAGVPCDDNNPCTTNSCAPEKGCSTKFSSAVCDDNDKCTKDDACSVGTCTGTKIDCDDGNACTNDSCSPKLGCVTSAAFGSCDDGDMCTINDYCEGEKCIGTAKTCDDGDPCTKDLCDPKQGCTTDVADGVPCSNTKFCITNGSCLSGVCQGKGCDDNNPCTDDKCGGGGPNTCTHSNNTAACDDKNDCTTGDTCSFGVCYGGQAKNCNDNNPCTNDSCANGACANVNNTVPCNDGDPCTLGDTCNAGTCKAGGTALQCNDNNTCTDDSCQKAMGGCTYTANSTPCDDQNVCTEKDACANKVCAPGTPKACEDNDACTQNTCNKAAGCQYPADTAKCDDANLCTTDSCSSPGGQCDHKATPNCCIKQAQCDDGDACTDDICAANQCVHKANGKCCVEDADCDDKTLCTADSCLLGKCQHANLPANATPAVIGDFEDLGDLQGWSPGPPVGAVGWQQFTAGGTATGTGAMLFGNPAKLQSVSGTVAGIVTSPKFTVASGGQATLALKWKQDYVGLNTIPAPLTVAILVAGKEMPGTTGAYNAAKAYQQLTVDLSPYGGQVVQVKITASIASNATTLNSGFGILVDDVEYQWACKAKACVADADCSNVSTCSAGQCLAGGCAYTFKCCAAAGDCNDNNPCTTDSCVASKCTYSKVAACCANNADCNDSNVCTFDTCNVGTNKCTFSGVAECCTNAAQCNDNDACTIDSCNAGTCTFKNTCCAADKDCNDGDDICTIDKCDAVTKKCTYTGTGKPGCCATSVFLDNFDVGLTNWTFQNSSGVPTKGWQIWNAPPAAPGAKSQPAVLYYGDPATKNFNFGANNGTATSPKIVLPTPATKLTVKGWIYMNTEGGGPGSYDDMYVYAVSDAGVKTTIFNKISPGFQIGAWYQFSGDVTAMAGKTITLQLYFNTLDGVLNDGLGVLLDDVAVERTCP